MIRRTFAFFAAVSALVALALVPAPAAAQFIGQPTWQSDPTGVCTYPGRSACPLVQAQEPVPYGATAETGASGDVAAATATATIAKAAAKTTYLTGLVVTGGGATGASVIVCTIVGPVTGTLTFDVPVPAGATLGITPVVINFPQAIPSSAVNTDIVVSCPTFGVGNLHAAVFATGYIR
jgi:hypothetical protein